MDNPVVSRQPIASQYLYRIKGLPISACTLYGKFYSTKKRIGHFLWNSVAYMNIFFFLLNIGLICKLHCLELDLRINYEELEK